MIHFLSGMAPAGGDGGGGGMGSMLIFLVAIFAVMYFFMIRPQQKRQKEHKKMLSDLKAGDKVIMAMENPKYLPARDTVKRLMPGKKFDYCVALREDIFRMIDLFFNIKRNELMEDSGSIEDILGQLNGMPEEEDDDDTDRVSEEDGAIVQLVNKMIVDAYNRSASDIHIEPRPGKANSVIRFRIRSRSTTRSPSMHWVRSLSVVHSTICSTPGAFL